MRHYIHKTGETDMPGMTEPSGPHARRLEVRGESAGRNRSTGRLRARLARGTSRRVSGWTCAVAFLLFSVASATGQVETEAVKKVDSDERLGERLIRKAVTKADDDIMYDILRLMSETSRRLEIDFNVGQDTQSLQARIVAELDQAIKVAAAQRRLQSSHDQPKSSDKRRMAEGPQQSTNRAKPAEAGGADSSSLDEGDASGADAESARVRGELRERRRAWGHLPLREREEIIQGIGDRFLERYRDWIERYYRALQETEEP